MTHADRYVRLESASIGRQMDHSFRATLYLLSSTSDMFGIAREFVSKQGINFDGMRRKADTLTGCVKQVIEAAYNLYSWNEDICSAPYTISTLEYPYMTKVCEAIYIASGKCDMQIYKDSSDRLQINLDLSKYHKCGIEKSEILALTIHLD